MSGEALRGALEQSLAGFDQRAIAAAVRRLGAGYGSGEAGAPRLDDPRSVAAYAAYRMPATYAAVRAVLAQLPALDPAILLDVGGGTGAAAWAAIDICPGLRSVTVTDRSKAALEFGRRLATQAPHEALRLARWERSDASAPIPAADLLTASYVLGELDPHARQGLIETMARSGATVVVVEPGTPEGYRRVLAAREQLLAHGHRVLAPCPHSAACPLTDTTDWCHFDVRLDRSALHRRVKSAELGYEDEKFAYVATAPGGQAAAVGRVLRHPQTRKGLVRLTVCQRDEQVAPIAVGRSAASYRAARDARWGDPWPPRDAG
ncbi:small ribosomal subunit Rsm22 family protein [soil metagenome]